MENWKPVVGFEGWYEVSDRGNLRRLLERDGKPLATPRVLSLAVDGDGYVNTKLSIGGRIFNKKRHTLVAEAFIGVAPRGKQVNHIDGVKTNNHVANLEWVTARENNRHARRTGLVRTLRGGECSWAKLTEDDVRWIRSVRPSLTLSSIAKQLGVSQALIDLVARRKTWKHVA